MIQYEYLTINLNGKDIDDSGDRFTSQLNKYGKSGWELASVISQPCLGSSQYSLLGFSQKNTLIFKRNKGYIGEEIE